MARRIIEKLKEERAANMSLARRLEPDAGSGEDSLRGPGAYYRGAANGLSIAIALLAADTEPEGPCPFCGSKDVGELEESGWYCTDCTHEWEKWPVAEPEGESET